LSPRKNHAFAAFVDAKYLRVAANTAVATGFPVPESPIIKNLADLAVPSEGSVVKDRADSANNVTPGFPME
jgi:hypothetical protein